MHHPSRPQNPSDGSTPVTGPPGTGGGDPAPERSFGRLDSTGGGEPDSPSWVRTRTRAGSPVDGLGVFQTRSIFQLPRRASSGYFSSDGDSVPSSPRCPRPPTADRATQTPSPSGQLVQHAMQRLAEAHQQHGRPPSTLHPEDAAEDMQAEAMQAEAVGRELRRIGDDFNTLLHRGMAGGHRRDEIPPNPPAHQEPSVLLCVGVLLLLIGRMIYLQGGTSSQDHSQV
ncbi:bcl-2-like protein 11 [Sebastes fasciatus]|uniref:bcl-2-like protein 11 n=1 Tax=Sebastes fasciatus TaxID=394691 RepID=UPI003D9E3CDA